MSRIGSWIKSQAPTRESFENSRFLKPFAARVFHPALWRFTRRSVPRGVALGLFVGIFLLVPGVQIAGVALLALQLRANVPIGAAMTFISIPPTTIFVILPGSVWIGNRLFGTHADVETVKRLLAEDASIARWVEWMFSDVALSLITGLFVVSVVSAAIGYILSVWYWRWWISRKWRRRSKSLAARG